MCCRFLILFLAAVVSFPVAAIASEVVTDTTDYAPADTVFITGASFQPFETVVLQVSYDDGDTLKGSAGLPWFATADQYGNVQSFWIAPYDLGPDDTLAVAGTGDSSGEEDVANFVVSPPKDLHQLQNGTSISAANWAKGNIHSGNSCYSEGRSVPYRYFLKGLAGETEHYFTISCEWTKGGIHGLDYFDDYDLSEASGITAAGGTCGSISTAPPPDCQAISGSFVFPDPTNSANYSGTIPPDFFPSGFSLASPRNLQFYNAIVDSVGPYYFSGTASDREFNLVVYFTVTDTASVGFYWGGHLAQGTPSTWGIGNGSGSIAGAPIHMRAGSLDGSGGSANRSIQGGTICLPPEATITCDSDSVCTDSSYTCFAPTAAVDYTWSVSGGTIVSGQGTDTITYTVTATSPGEVTIALAACDTTSGCPGDQCCNVDTVQIPLGNCCDPPSATCPGDTAIFVCDLSQICLPGFDCNGTATVLGGTLSGNDVCFTPVVGVNTITLICTNDCGNADTCITNVTITLNSAPVCSIPNDTTISQCDPAQVSLPVGATDVDGNLVGCSVTSGPGSIVGGNWVYTPTSEETVNVTVTCTDQCGASCNGSFQVIFDINEPPTITCPADVTVGCDESTDPSNTGNATATDPESTPIVTYWDSETAGSCPQEKTITRTWVAVDDCNDSATCIQTIDVVDTAAPVIVCPPDMSVNCGGSVDPSNTGTATATDNCDPSPVVTYTDAVNSDTLTRTWTATDACGNADSCVQIILTEDTTPPVITCPADATIDCSESTDPANTGSATATDDCDPNPTVTYSDSEVPGSCPQEKVITRTWTATDNANNSAQCVQTITVTDDIAPVITCPANIAIDCNASTDPSNTGSATATDNCDPAPAIIYSDSQVGDVITRTWTATDACGNSSQCPQTITIQDTTPPVITCPADATIDCSESTDPSNTGSATATDDCDPNPTITYSDSEVPGSCPQEKVITRTWTATDADNNSSQCDQIITVTDDIAPVITCPADVAIGCNASTDPSNTGSSTATDNCDPAPAIAYSDSQVGNVITRTWTATDACGNSSQCPQTITIQDTTPPVITCPADATIDCSESTDPANTGSATATDDCDPNPTVTYSDSEVPGSCPQEKVITRTWTATDNANNSSQCDQTITVTDDIDPVITCPANITIDCAASTDPANTGTATATDNCDSNPAITYSDSETAGSCPQEKVITRTWVATDACGNSAQCDQIITVEDNIAPTITRPADDTVDCTESTDPANTGSATATDNCDQAPVITYSDTEADGSCPQEKVITRTWTATDACGNSADSVQIINVTDQIGPTITCPADIQIDCGESIDPSNTGTATAIDNCDPNPVVVYSDSQQGNVITRTWTATDACGNDPSCVQIITIGDGTPPVCNLPGDQSIFQCQPTEVQLPVSATNDASCEIITGPGVIANGFWVYTPSGSETQVVTVRCTDLCSLFCEGSFTVEFEMNSAPQVSLPQSTGYSHFCGPTGAYQICVDFNYSDVDDNITDVSVAGQLPTTVTHANGQGTFCFTPPAVDSVYDFTVTVEDFCNVTANASYTHTIDVDEDCDTSTCFILKIEKTHNTLQGHYEFVSITTEGSTLEMGGFDLLIAYDASALAFTGAEPGQLLEDCGWEYFTYRYGVQGNCGNACPSGLLRIIAIADVNNGPNHPSCFGPPDTDPHELARIRFYVTNDRTYECMYVPIYFFWDNCGDNSISTITGDTLYIEKKIYDFEGNLIWDEEDDDLFPEDARIPFVGAPDYCLEGDKTYPIRCIEFWYGGIDIVCADSIDRCGDLNLNGIDNEIADAVVYTNYFLFGPSALDINTPAQTAASDVNADGQPLTVGDLVYMIRILTGDAFPYPKLAPFAASAEISIVDGQLRSTSSTEIGAVWAVYDLAGNHSITNHTDMELASNISGDQLMILLYSGFDNMTGRVPAGSARLFSVIGDAELVSIQVSDYNGNLLEPRLSKSALPTDFALHQNVPNPFNPTTRIMFDLPVVSDWSLGIYNVRGQLVENFSGNGIGTVTVNWNASAVASGVYFYKLTAGNFTDTRKMVLMK